MKLLAMRSAAALLHSFHDQTSVGRFLCHSVEMTRAAVLLAG